MRKQNHSIRLTPQRGQEYLAYNTLEHQRNIIPPRLAELITKLRSGDFHFCCIAIVHYGKSTLLINGQHQCSAVVETGIAVDGNLHEYWLEGNENQADIAKLFAQYDDGGIRTPGQVAWMYALAFDMTGMSRGSVTKCTTAASWLEWNGGSSQRRKDERGQLLEKYRDKCLFIEKVAFNGSTASARHIQRAPILAAMMQTYDVNQKASREFWTDVRDGSQLEPGSPQHKIRDWLLSHKIGTQRTSAAASDNGRCCYKEAYDRCIHAWNAFREGGETRLSYRPDKPSPQAR
jgi:hypothetical protein